MQLFNPPENLKQNSSFKSMQEYFDLQKEFENNYENKWLELAKDNLEWFKKPEISLNSDNAPFYSWFEDWEINAAYECLDANIEKYWDKTAIIFEAENAETKK